MLNLVVTLFDHRPHCRRARVRRHRGAPRLKSRRSYSSSHCCCFLVAAVAGARASGSPDASVICLVMCVPRDLS